MTDANAFHAAAAEFYAADDDTLFEQIGLRQSAMQRDLSVAAQLSPKVTAADGVLSAREDLLNLGRRIYKRVSREVYKILCGDGEDDRRDRDALRDALQLTDVALAAALTPVLISLAVPPPLAPLIAALLVRRVIVPAAGEVCAFWTEQLNEGAA
ncbi:MAG: hypothetical protein AAFY88_04080 [Acidobacteriota bacterium]